MDHHFLSYASIDEAFARQLHDTLEAGSISVWIDKYDEQPGLDWDAQIVEAIRTCASVLFVMTPDSVADTSTCKQEWTLGLRYKKPIIPLLLDPAAEMPFRLAPRHYIDCTGPLAPAVAQLRNHLRWLVSPAGELQALKDRLADAQRDLRRARDLTEQTRIRDEIAQLTQQMTRQQQVVDDPQGVAERVEEHIARGLERDRQPETPVSGLSRTKFINPPPVVAPSYFQDRHVETRLVGDFLQEEAQRLITVVGRGGSGKTALVCRLLKALERGQLPDDGGELGVDGIVYLSALGARPLAFYTLFADLGALLPPPVADQLDALYRDPQVSTTEKMRALLAHFPAGRTVVLLDNFEDVVDAERLSVRDGELDEALRALLEAPQHGVKVIITTRVAPRSLALVQPGRQRRLDLDEGLGSPYAENILRAMDPLGTLGLKAAPETLLSTARERTRGYPRALEALAAILSADRSTTLPEILADATQLLPENVVDVLVGEAFSRLDVGAQRVLQALAIYEHPVTAAAVDYLLQPYVAGVDSAPVLNRLVNMQFVRKEGGRYYLHPVDRTYALSRTAVGVAADREAAAPPFTQFALRDRGADYFEQIRTPREHWKTIGDLEPQLAEFELRYAGHDYDTAADVLEEIDADYLFVWGYYRLVADLHERLLGKLRNPWTTMRSIGTLAIACYQMGQPEQARSYHEQALAIAREIGDRRNEGACLGGLGQVSEILGQLEQARSYYVQVLAIAREIGDRGSEGWGLGSLGNVARALGQLEPARSYYEQALAIARAIGDRGSEGTWLGNLGNVASALGQLEPARSYYEQALAIAREIGERYQEANNLDSLADVLIDQGQYEVAAQHAREGAAIAREIGSPALGSYTNSRLALALLCAGDLPAARDAAEAARQHDNPRHNHNVLAWLGIIALRQADRVAAREAFTGAVAQAEALLSQSAQNYDVLDAKGLALCGLALCDDDGTRVAAAIAAYRAARAATRAAGVVQRALLLFDLLAVADTAALLAPVRAIAGGSG